MDSISKTSGKQVAKRGVESCGALNLGEEASEEEKCWDGRKLYGGACLAVF
jgi:hypothetical protein